MALLVTQKYLLWHWNFDGLYCNKLINRLRCYIAWIFGIFYSTDYLILLRDDFVCTTALITLFPVWKKRKETRRVRSLLIRETKDAAFKRERERVWKTACCALYVRKRKRRRTRGRWIDGRGRVRRRERISAN